MGKEHVKRKKSTAIQFSMEDKILYSIVTVVLTVFTILVAYPMIYVLSSSFSSGTAISSGQFILLPVDLSLE